MLKGPMVVAHVVEFVPPEVSGSNPVIDIFTANCIAKTKIKGKEIGQLFIRV